MKNLHKPFSILLALTMIMILGGCASGNNSLNKEMENPTNTQTSVGVTDNPEASSPQSTAEDSSSSKSLVVYFSWSGNTDQMAQWVADESSSDLYRVTPAEDYGPDYQATADRAKNELDNGIRPDLVNLMNAEALVQYDTIYLGFPIWWYDLPMPMTSFLENYDLSGKTIIPFFSHNGSGSGAGSLDTLVEICKGATILTDEVLSISGNSVDNSESAIREWVNNLN